MLRGSASTYVQVYEECIGKRYWVTKKNAGRFRQLDYELRVQGIDPENYIRVSVKIWQGFLDKQGIPFLPLNILMSQKAIDRYVELDPITDQAFDLGLIRSYEDGVVVIKLEGLLGVRESWESDLQEFLPEGYDELVSKYPKEWSRLSRAALKNTAQHYKVTPDFMDVESIAQAIISRREKVL